MKRFLFLSFFILSFISLYAQNLSNLNELIKKHQNSKMFKNAQWGLCARYLDTDQEIISVDAEKSVAPASNLKLFTTSAALEYLGEDFTFETKLYLNGKIDQNGILFGDIFIKGGGDPTLGYDLVKSSLPLDKLMLRLTKDIKVLGIKEIKGDIIADDLLYSGTEIPDNWQWIDLGNYYATTVSALTIHNNLYFLYFKPAKKVGDFAEVLRTEPEIPGLTFTNHMKTGKKGSGDNGYIYGAPLQFETVLRGTIPAGVEEFSIKGSIPDPPLFAAQYLKKTLLESGIKINGKTKKLAEKIAYQNFTLITSIISPPLKEIVKTINKRSDNLYTELLLKAIGYKVYNEGTTEKGADAVEKFLKNNKVNTDGLILSDGSGLSRTNAITTKMMVNLLEVLQSKSYFKTFFNSLALMGDPDDIGFFRNTGKGTAMEKNVRLKSGAIQGVRSYSGYLQDKNKRIIAFSLIANNFIGSGGSVNQIHREILNELANLK